MDYLEVYIRLRSKAFKISVEPKKLTKKKYEIKDLEYLVTFALSGEFCTITYNMI